MVEYETLDKFDLGIFKLVNDDQIYSYNKKTGEVIKR